MLFKAIVYNIIYSVTGYTPQELDQHREYLMRKLFKTTKTANYQHKNKVGTHSAKIPKTNSLTVIQTKTIF